ncbi:uncharacterized protein JCM6883_005667 [Sporobolomyces salmoneus]|uniref:uncharacterized protein n=1 Tax=Sporobolomyces salmoneus TaxID=183962 RepID=UPI0031776024
MLSCHRLLSIFVSLGLLLTCQASPVPSSAIVSTSKGQVQGYSGSSGNRYTIPYGKSPTQALRFRRSEAIESFTSLYDASKLPKACLQQASNDTPENQSEDCLFMNIFTPKNAQPTSKLPVFVWVHGGSFLAGSTKDLDGFALANSQNMIVVTVQYRLGYFGWLKYDPWGVEGNMGLRDVILALQTVQQDIGAFGGDSSLVTLAGQSSGAQMVKALLSTPSASSLFKRAIIHSAPLDYSPQAPALANAVGSAFLFDIAFAGNSICGKQNSGCLWRRTSPQEFFQAQSALVYAALKGAFGDSVPFAEPFNIVADGELVTGDGQQIVNTDKEIIFTTVKDEGCPAVATALPFVADETNDQIIETFFRGRASAIIQSGLYPTEGADSTAVESTLVQLATDFYWVCPNQQFATAAASKSTVYLGEFDLGIQAATTAAFPQCDNKVGHEDDISVVFNRSSSSLSSAQTNLVKEVQARWGAFTRSGNPNASGYSNWPALPSNGGGLEVLKLGAGSNGASSLATSQRTEACKLYGSI